MISTNNLKYLLCPYNICFIQNYIIVKVNEVGIIRLSIYIHNNVVLIFNELQLKSVIEENRYTLFSLKYPYNHVIGYTIIAINKSEVSRCLQFPAFCIAAGYFPEMKITQNCIMLVLHYLYIFEKIVKLTMSFMIGLTIQYMNIHLS